MRYLSLNRVADRRQPRTGQSRSLFVLIGLGLAGVLEAPVFAQQPVDDVAAWAAATLPENNEALLLSSRAEDAISAGDFRLAIELIDRIYDLPAGLVAAPATSIFYPLPRQAARLLARLPEEGIEFFRQLYDAEVDARYADAVKVGDRTELEYLFRRRRLATRWPTIATELAAQLIDRGRFADAIEVTREARQVLDASKTTTLQALEVIALAGVGAGQAADQALRRLQQGGVPEALASRAEDLLAWTGAAQQRGAALDPLLSSGPVWQQALGVTEGAALLPDASEIADAIGDSRRLPLLEPTLGDGALIIRASGHTFCFDALTLAPRWSERESGSLSDPAGALDGAHQGDLDGVGMLLGNHLRHVSSIGAGQVFSIEGLTSEVSPIETFGWRPNAGISEPVRRNEVVARDLKSGAVRWRTSDDMDSPLFDVAFQDRPLLIAGRLACLFRRGDDLLLAFVDPSDGRLLQEMPVVGPPTYFTGDGGRSLLSADETTLYVLTGSGVVAAIGALDGEWKWASVYQSNLAERLGRLPWQAMEPPSEWNVERPILADDLLILAPIDSPAIFALDRFTGSERWRLPRGEHSYVVGVVDNGLVLGGRRLACLDLSRPDPDAPRWRSAPLEITGRPVTHSTRVFAPTGAGVAVLDGRSGKLLADQGFAGPQATESADAQRATMTLRLAVSTIGLYAISADRVAFYPDLARAKSEFERAQLPRSQGSSYGLAWLAALDGRLDEAAAKLTTLPDAPSDIPVAARRTLQRHIWLGRASRAVGAERVELLRQAQALTSAAEEGARLSIEIGAALSAAGQSSQALDHYIGMLASNAVLPADPTERFVSASWLTAVARIRELLRSMSPADASAALAGHARAAKDPGQLVALQRLAIAVEGNPYAADVRRALLESNLPPELALQYLGDDRQGVDEARDRGLLLRRWETHVSLNLLELADKDRNAWAQLVGESPSPEDAERVAGIEKSARKLRAAQPPPLEAEMGLRWKIEEAELFADADRPQLWARPWLMIREHQKRQIQMISAHQPDYPWRKTPDGLTRGALSLAELDRQLFGRPGVDEGRLGAGWPIITHENLAAIPVPGGLVSVGLGPERHAGNFLWEHAIPAWGHIPGRFAERSAAGPLGVYCAPRGDRVLLLGWLDGQVWWRRDFPGDTIDRVQLFGDTLFVISEDSQIWAFDAFNGAARGLALDDLGPRRAATLVNGTLIVWGDDFIAGVDARTRKVRWRSEIPAIEDVHAVPEQGWLAWKQRGARVWRMLDVQKGEVVGPASLGEYERMNAIAMSGDRLLVAGQGELGENGDEAGHVTVSCFGPDSATPLWQVNLPSRVRVNFTQLVGHPEYIPLLVARPSRGGVFDGVDLPAIVMIRRSDGQALPPRSIKGDYKVTDAACDMCLIASPTRIIVQVSKTLLGFGSGAKAGGGAP